MNTMNKFEFIELCPIFALGALDAQERESFLAALNTADEEMMAAFAEAALVAENLSLATPIATPSSAVRQRLLSRIRDKAKPKAISSRPRVSRSEVSWIEKLFPSSPRFGLAAVFGMLALCFGLAAYVFYLRGNLGRQGMALKESRNHLVALEDSLSQKNAMLEVLQSKDMHYVAMNGLEVNPSGYGKVLWDPQRKVAVLQVYLPPESADKDYQLWVIRDKKPVDAGVFQVNASGQKGMLYKIDRLVETDKNHINAFAVTLEPKGGVPQPTGKMYLLGSITL